MKRAASLSKFMIGMCVVGSIFAYVESAYDSRFYSDSFLTDANRNISSEDLEISEADRFENGLVAGSEISLNDVPEAVKYQPKIQEIGMNMSPLVNGNWEVIRHYEHEGKVFFDRTNESARPDDFYADFSIKLALVEKSLVMIDEVQTELFNISLMTRHGTIKLFRPLGDSFEIIEARKLKKVAIEEETTLEQNSSGNDGFHVEDKTCFLKAHAPRLGNKILMGEDALQGMISINNDEISLEGITLKHMDANGNEKSTETLTFSGMIQDNGTIFQDGIGGHVSIIGKKEIRIMFAQGPLAQATLTFGIGDRCEAEMAQLAPEKEQEFEEMMEERNAVDSDNGERLNPADQMGTVENFQEERSEDEVEEEFSDEAFEGEEFEEDELDEEGQFEEGGEAVNDQNGFSF